MRVSQKPYLLIIHHILWSKTSGIMMTKLIHIMDKIVAEKLLKLSEDG